MGKKILDVNFWTFEANRVKIRPLQLVSDMFHQAPVINLESNKNRIVEHQVENLTNFSDFETCRLQTRKMEKIHVLPCEETGNKTQA